MRSSPSDGYPAPQACGAASRVRRVRTGWIPGGDESRAELLPDKCTIRLNDEPQAKRLPDKVHRPTGRPATWSACSHQVAEDGGHQLAPIVHENSRSRGLVISGGPSGDSVWWWGVGVAVLVFRRLSAPPGLLGGRSRPARSGAFPGGCR